MRFQVLGTVRVVSRGVPLALGGPKHHAVLHYLVLRANSVVPMDDLLTALWGEASPRTGRKMVQNIVSELRGVLAQDDEPTPSVMLLTHAPGYLLRVDPDLIDVTRFRKLVREGLGQDRATSAATLRAALELWHHPPAEVPDWPEARDLDDLRAGAEAELEAANSPGGNRLDGPTGTVLVISAETPPITGEDLARVMRRENWALAAVRDWVGRCRGVVRTVFGSLVVATFADLPDSSGFDRARAAARGCADRLGGSDPNRSATVSSVLLSGLAELAEQDAVPDAVVDEGMRLLAEIEPGSTRYCQLPGAGGVNGEVTVFSPREPRARW